MARIRIAYIGGGSTRAPGTLASIVTRGPQFAGSEVVLVDLDKERMAIVKQLTERMAAAHGVDLRVSTTTDRREALEDADFVLSSFRPGGFEARYLDESIPARHGVLGQETQGPGGFFMALRSIQVIRAIVEDMERICPTAFLINYTNPVNIVSEAVTHNSPIRTISLCEGPITFPQAIVRNAGLDPRRLDAVHVGLNHTGWTVRHLYDGQDVMPLIREAAVARAKDPSSNPRGDRMLHLAAAMGALPAWYLYYYYYREEALAEQRASPTTRAQDILAEVGGYWSHYREQAASDDPVLDRPALAAAFSSSSSPSTSSMRSPTTSAGRGLRTSRTKGRCRGSPTTWSSRSRPTSIARAPADPAGTLARARSRADPDAGCVPGGHRRGGGSGTRRDAVAALASNPLVLSLPLAERLYDEMAAAHRQHLPLRLLEG